MATKKTSKAKRVTQKVSKPATKVTVQRDTKTSGFDLSQFAQKLQNDLRNRDSSFSLILGALIVIVLGVILFNLFNKTSSSQNTTPAAAQTQSGDVDKNSLPGKYTVKDGDTLYSIAQKYYGDGYQFNQIVKANNLPDENNITVGQVLEIPKLTASPSPTASTSASPSGSQQVSQQNTQLTQGTGGSNSETEWGPTITGGTYTVQAGDWLSKIAGRAYGDIYSYNKIAQANNISDPNLIEPGTVLTIPR